VAQVRKQAPSSSRNAAAEFCRTILLKCPK
jgi:hypothetical protein